MIKNDRQYRITKSAAANFESALEQFESSAEVPDLGIDPIIQNAQRNAIAEQLKDLRAELREYEDLISGKVGVIELGSLADLPRALVRARIASGKSQKELAEKLGMKEQQIQRYEAADYQQASLSRLLEVAEALQLNIRKDLLLPNADRTPTSVFSRFKEIGFSKQFVLDRLVPREVVADFAREGKTAIDRLLFCATRAAAHVFGWTPAAMLGEGRPWLDKGVLGAARFKASESAEQKSFTVYTFYAHFLALLLLKATEHLQPQPLPTDPDEVHSQIVGRYGDLSLRSALRYCWDLGVPVLPLNDAGAFHGACWRVDGRNVIVLKQRTRSVARWLFDLLHEFRHAGEKPSSLTHDVIEEAETSVERLNSEEEKEANWFAGEVTLGGRAESLVEECIKRAGGQIPRLKRVVPQVASAADVESALLANYMAYRLSMQGHNWWGTATNLQPGDEGPWEIARDILLERADLSRLSGLDRDLFLQGLNEPED